MLAFSPDDDTAAEALAAVARITGGNFRPVQRLFAQIARILEVNAPRAIAKEVVETTRESLVIRPRAPGPLRHRVLKVYVRNR